MNLAPSHRSLSMKHVLQWGIPFGITCLIIIGVVASSVFFYSYRYADKIFPGVQIADLSLGGLTPAQAQKLLEERVSRLTKQELVFQWNEERISLHPSAKHSYIAFDTAPSIKAAYAIGRSNTTFQNAFIQLDARVRGRVIPLASHLADKAIEEDLRHALGSRIQPAEDATFQIKRATEGAGYSVSLQEEREGRDLQMQPILQKLRAHVLALNFASPIQIPIAITHPTRTTQDLAPLVPAAESWIRYAPITLIAQDKNWSVPTSTVATWITTTSTPSGWEIDLDATLVNRDLQKILGPILKPAVEGNLIVKDGHVEEFTTPVEGIAIDTTSTIALLKTHQNTNATSTSVTLIHTTPLILGDGETLGIKEVLGVGHSEFTGSPSNRRKNIALGAKKVNGTLLAPDQEFSLLKTLGKIDGENGWLQELVIKGDKTTPEFGGGLCQIGTTSFRAALNSGLPITERQNHSYRVRYYEPAGTDATIYDPAPDFRFKNDTGHWILLTTEIKGDTATFTYWGTKDGRTAQQTYPKISNIVPPPPKKEIETLELKPGTVKCTEVAHAGADASFDYTVTYPGQEPKKVTFNSHYKPWGAVCLKGVSQLSATSTPATSSTEPLIP